MEKLKNEKLLNSLNFARIPMQIGTVGQILAYKNKDQNSHGIRLGQFA